MPALIDLGAFARLNSPPPTSAEMQRLAKRLPLIYRTVTEQAEYLEGLGTDRDIFSSYWIEYFGVEYFRTIAEKISRADSGMIDRLRLIYNFTGMPIVGYRRPETFPLWTRFGRGTLNCGR